MPFAAPHFAGRVGWALEHLPAASNVFLWQMLQGGDPRGHGHGGWACRRRLRQRRSRWCAAPWTPRSRPTAASTTSSTSPTSSIGSMPTRRQPRWRWQPTVAARRGGAAGHPPAQQLCWKAMQRLALRLECGTCAWPSARMRATVQASSTARRTSHSASRDHQAPRSRRCCSSRSRQRSARASSRQRLPRSRAEGRFRIDHGDDPTRFFRGARRGRAHRR